MKKIFTFAAALLASLSMMAVEPTFESTDWTKDVTVFGDVFTNHSSEGVTLTTDKTDWGGNFSGHLYVASGGGTDVTADSWTNWVGVSAANTIDSIAILWAPNGTNASSIAWIGWESGITPSKEVGTNYGVGATYTASKSWDAAKWETFSFVGKDLTTIYFSRQWKKCTNNGSTLSNFGGNQTINFLGIKVWVSGVAPATKYTVTYMDGETVLGTESVKEGENATKASTYEAKAHATFNGWYNDAAFTSAADFTAAITADKTFYGKWTADAFVESSSLNIEQGIIDNTKSWDIAAALTSAHIAYKNIDALDSLNSDKGDNNEPYLGLKLKTAGAFVEMGVGAGHILEVKFGHVDADIKVNGTTVAKGTLGTPYRYTASENGYVRVETTTGGTVVLKQINILTEIAASADLSTITVNGKAISGFKADSLNYTYALPYGTTENPVIAATAVDPNATVAVDPITSLTQLVNIVVTSGTLTKTYTVQLSIAGAPKDLYEAVFSNGAKASIYGNTVEVAYMGTVPTLVSDSVSTGATASLEGNVLTITGADQTTRTLNVTFVELTAPAYSADTITFDGEEDYVYGHYGWDEAKGWKFAKAVDEADNMRIAEGKTRIYMALPACNGVSLISGSGANRAVKIYVNNVLSSVNKTAAANAAIRIELDDTQVNFVAIESNQTSGDGGFIKMVLDNDTPTSINNVEAAKAIKVIENGQIVIIKNGVRYNTVGAKL